MTKDTLFSQAMKAAWADPNSKFHSPEYKEKIRAAALKHQPALSARMKAMWAEGGRLNNPEVREKMSAAMKATTRTPEYRARVSAHMKAYWAKRREEAK